LDVLRISRASLDNVGYPTIISSNKVYTKVIYMISEYVAKQRTQVLLTAMLGSKLVDTWWTSPNKAFNGKIPAEVWLQDYTKVYDYVMRNADGGW
jgi:hypothetical protein